MEYGDRAESRWDGMRVERRRNGCVPPRRGGIFAFRPFGTVWLSRDSFFTNIMSRRDNKTVNSLYLIVISLNILL